MIYFLKFKETPFLIYSQQQKFKIPSVLTLLKFFVTIPFGIRNPQIRNRNRTPEGRALFIYPLQGSRIGFTRPWGGGAGVYVVGVSSNLCTQLVIQVMVNCWKVETKTTKKHGSNSR